MTDEYAFPWKNDSGYLSPGMSLRDYFAGQALAGLYYRGQYTDKVAAAIAYEAADAMLRAGDK